MEIGVGLRVVRGPDWKWSNQDDGEGHCGTVVEIGKPGSHTTPDKTVVVQWDSGSRTNYRIGYQNAHDLRVLDNAPIGVRHPNIICNGCKKHGIAGMRWKCLVCQSVDLCTLCYMSDKHDVNHPFARFETNSSPGIEMQKRNSKNNVKLEARGIFVGARVIRGYDWDWANQDGGEGKIGKVIDIRGWDNESRRSVANVMWASGSTNVYRLGHKGKVDLKYAVDSIGPCFYRNHLPVLGQHIEGTNRLIPSRTSAISEDHVNSSLFNVGDKVKVIIDDVNELKLYQEGHGGWNQRMADFIGHIGTIHRITDRGDIRVQFEGCHNRWTFNPIALNKVISYSVGDIVKISDDKNKVKDLQKSHGEWIDLMHGALGKMGKIVKLYADGDLRVTVDGQTWTFNPQCVSLMPGSATEMNNTMTAHPSREETNVRLGNLLEHNPVSSSSQHNISNDEPSPSSTSAFVSLANKEDLAREAAQGRFEAVKDIVERFPDYVDSKSCGKTALQVAAHQGHTDIVEFLLNSNANINLRDDEGDTALHYSAFGNQASIIELLLKEGSDIDAVNRTRCSALHIAVNKGHLECVRVLIKFGCNVNLQDNYGDTALHDAISKTDNLEIIDALISSPRIDFSLKNRRGFNALHHSALKGNHFAAEKIINKSRQLVDVKKEDGYAALHLSSLNGHYQIVETLIIQGQADINIVNNRKQTPLHLAVSQCHCPIVELLVNLGANVNHINEDNDTALHIAISKGRELLKSDSIILNSTAITEFLSQLSLIGFGQNIHIAIACFLIQDGNADINLKNRKSKTPIDLLEMLKENETDLVSHNFSQLKEFVMNLVENSGIGRNSSNSNGRAVNVTTMLTRYDDVVEEHSQSECEPNATLNNSNDTAINEVENSVECIICNECVANVIFEPCNHLLLCELCSTRIKKCIKCNKTITSKILTHSNNIVNNDHEYLNTDITLPKVSVERLKYLESKIAEIEEANSCTICLVPYSNSVLRMAFLCGHSACFNCSQTLKICHMCRKTITKKINLY